MYYWYWLFCIPLPCFWRQDWWACWPCLITSNVDHFEGMDVQAVWSRWIVHFIYIILSALCPTVGLGLDWYGVHIGTGTAIESADDEPTPMASEHPADVGAQHQYVIPQLYTLTVPWVLEHSFFHRRLPVAKHIMEKVWISLVKVRLWWKCPFPYCKFS